MKNIKECCYLLLTTAAAAAAADTADTADSFYAANTADTADNFGWVDGCSFGVGLDGWLGWSPQKLKRHLDLQIPMKVISITRERWREEAECRQVLSLEIHCLLLIPFCIIV